VTLLYGGVTTLVAVELNRATGILPSFRQLDNGGLLVIILAGGSLGLLVARKMFASAGQWGSVHRFALALPGALAVESAISGSLALALFCLMVVSMHIVLPKVLHG
jgi:hypothetical protein